MNEKLFHPSSSSGPSSASYRVDPPVSSSSSPYASPQFAVSLTNSFASPTVTTTIGGGSGGGKSGGDGGGSSGISIGGEDGGGGGGARRVSEGLGGNLSELDSLLESLNSAQFMAEVERKAGERKLCEYI